MDEREMNDKVIAFRDLINNLLGAATSSERIDARRELVGEYQQVLKELCETRRTTPDRDAIIEECARACERVAEGRSVVEMNVGAKLCADVVRALKTTPTAASREEGNG
ncbi:hypothetical protein [Burkholderia multivorans]|uniref:hypothetical protein n=1 Tax=Burkholderia multivorans TaxID=87883 RepID=UPI0012D9EF67|nr:hypothetical protein [Burkholderia multivorans]